MNDIMISFQYFVVKHNIDFDLTLDDNGEYKSKKTRNAYFWYCKGFIQGEKG